MRMFKSKSQHLFLPGIGKVNGILIGDQFSIYCPSLLEEVCQEEMVRPIIVEKTKEVIPDKIEVVIETQPELIPITQEPIEVTVTADEQASEEDVESREKAAKLKIKMEELRSRRGRKKHEEV